MPGAKTRVGRRAFLKTVCACAAPYVLGRTARGAPPPSNRINMGFIGTGNQGSQLLKGFMQNADVQVLAVCDVNTASYGYKTADQFLGREPARRMVEEHYAAEARSGSWRGCAAVADFREVLARPDIDAVAIAVPDHWHAVMTVMAARSGKDIYCEKPLSLTVEDGRAMVEAVRRAAVICQVGSHERSRRQTRFACELVRSGRIGRLRRILAIVGPNNKEGPPAGWTPQPVPPGFDYDMWLGPAPWEPYHPDRCLYNFRFILDYSGGQVTNYGAHSLDIAQWGAGKELTGPVEVEDRGAEFPRDGLFNTATTVRFAARYADGLLLECITRADNMACRFEGDAGWVEVGYGGFFTQPESLKRETIGPSEIHLYESNDHYRNFLDCVRSRREPAAPVEVGHRSATLCHLGNIAMLLGRRLRWDPEAERFVGDDEANRMLGRARRSPWNV